MRWLIRMTLVALVLTVAADSGWSQPGQDEEARRRAGAHVERGDQFKEAGNYQAAADEYLAAYELVPHPVLFFNLGQVYRLGGELEVALDYYQQYLDAEPDGRAADQSRGYVKALRAELDRRSAGSKGGDPDAGENGTGSGQGEKNDTGDGKGRGSAGAGSAGSGGTVTKGPGDRPSKGKTLRIAGMASAGVGLVAVALGVKFGFDAASISDELSGHDQTWTEELLAKQEQGRTAQTRMWLFSGVGAAAIVAGGALYYLGHRADANRPEGRLTATPMLSGQAAGFAISGRF